MMFLVKVTRTALIAESRLVVVSARNESAAKQIAMEQWESGSYLNEKLIKINNFHAVTLPSYRSNP